MKPPKRDKWLSRWLKPMGEIYRHAANARRKAYEDGRRSQKKLPRPVISVGNLTVGGTGKTPFVIYLCGKLSGWGHIAILTRGYGRKNSRGYLVVPPARRLDQKATRFFGDEPIMMASRVVNTSIHVGPNRFQAGIRALDRSPVDMFILDDGFQHIELFRDLDILMLNGQADLKSLDVLPAGSLREAPEMLTRADIIVINQCDPEGNHVIDLEWVRSINPNAPIALSTYEIEGVYSAMTGTMIPTEEITKIDLKGFAGIADPESFRCMLEKYDFKVNNFSHFPDHHFYRPREIDELIQSAKAEGAEGLITTEKDLVRLPKEKFSSFPFYYLVINTKILKGEEAMWEQIGKAIYVN